MTTDDLIGTLFGVVAFFVIAAIAIMWIIFPLLVYSQLKSLNAKGAQLVEFASKISVNLQRSHDHLAWIENHCRRTADAVNPPPAELPSEPPTVT